MYPNLWGRFPDLVCLWFSKNTVSIVWPSDWLRSGLIWFGFLCIFIFFMGIVLLEGILDVNIIQMTDVQRPIPQSDDSLVDFVVTCQGT